jgi:hypothetical protein
MRYATGADFRRSLETRLRIASQQDHTPLARLRKFVAFDRLLARLLSAEPDGWVLKGGLALQLRLGQRARTTKDMDIMSWHRPMIQHRQLSDAAAVDLHDWFQFSIERSELEPEPLPGGGRRFHVRALLDSRPFETFHVDMGIDDPMIEPVQLLPMPDLLAFAGIAPTLVPCFPVAQQIAEKVHAYTRPHPSGVSSRVKDLVDILLLAELQPLDGSLLHRSIVATFSAREMHVLPQALPPPPETWVQPFRRMAEETDLAWQKLDDAMLAAQRFIGPVLVAPDAGRWNPFRWTWERQSPA